MGRLKGYFHGRHGQFLMITIVFSVAAWRFKCNFDFARNYCIDACQRLQNTSANWPAPREVRHGPPNETNCPSLQDEEMDDEHDFGASCIVANDAGRGYALGR